MLPYTEKLFHNINKNAIDFGPMLEFIVLLIYFHNDLINVSLGHIKDH